MRREAAFREGGPWLDALRAYLSENKREAREFLCRELPVIRAVPSDATYLLFLDCGALLSPGESADGLALFLREKAGLYLSAGSGYGKGGEAFLRMNVACPRATVLEGLGRLKQGVEAFVRTRRK